MKVEIYLGGGYMTEMELDHVPRQGEWLGIDAKLYRIEKVIYHSQGVNLAVEKELS